VLNEKHGFDVSRFAGILMIMDEVRKIPVTIVTGFLGSGKTTIISFLIDYLLEKNVKVAYIKNEIGSEDIDGKLMRGKHIDTKELLNGCICCTLTGPFYHAVTELVETIHPDRIIIEASGVADPSAIALLVSTHPRVYREGVIGVIDVVNFEGYKDLSLTAGRQAQFTDIIVFNKIEMVTLARKKSVVGFVRELNDVTPIVEAPHGFLDPQFAFGITSIERVWKEDKKSLHTHGSHLSDELISTVHFSHFGRMDTEKVMEILDQLPCAVIRVKGFIQTDNGMFLVNKVGNHTTIVKDETCSDQKDNHIVCIGFALSEWEKDIQMKLTSACEPS
jgi:G3E family GTPase